MVISLKGTDICNSRWPENHRLSMLLPQLAQRVVRAKETGCSHLLTNTQNSRSMIQSVKVLRLSNVGITHPYNDVDLFDDTCGAGMAPQRLSGRSRC